MMAARARSDCACELVSLRSDEDYEEQESFVLFVASQFCERVIA